MDFYFETQLLLLQTIETEELSDEELRQLLAPSSTLLFEAGRWFVGYIGRQFGKWGSWMQQFVPSA